MLNTRCRKLHSTQWQGNIDYSWNANVSELRKIIFPWYYKYNISTAGHSNVFYRRLNSPVQYHMPSKLIVCSTLATIRSIRIKCERHINCSNFQADINIDYKQGRLFVNNNTKHWVTWIFSCMHEQSIRLSSQIHRLMTAIISGFQK